MLWASSGAARDLLGVSTLLPSIRPRIPTMGERTSHQDASLSHTSSQQRSNVAVELPPPYTERESPIAALTRRIGRPPNATAESANVADSHRSSRRSLDQRTKQSRTLVVRLGCALLLIGLLVSCTAFVLALVSFSASDTQHLQQQVRMLLVTVHVRRLRVVVFRIPIPCLPIARKIFSLRCDSMCSSTPCETNSRRYKRPTESYRR